MGGVLMKNIIKQWLVAIFMAGFFGMLQAADGRWMVTITNNTPDTLVQINRFYAVPDPRIEAGTTVELDAVNLNYIAYEAGCGSCMQWLRDALCGCLIEYIPGQVVRDYWRERNYTLIIEAGQDGALYIHPEYSRVWRTFQRAALAVVNVATRVSGAVESLVERVGGAAAVHGAIEGLGVVEPYADRMSEGPLAHRAAAVVAAGTIGYRRYQEAATQYEDDEARAAEAARQEALPWYLKKSK